MIQKFFKLIVSFSFLVTAANAADLEYADGSTWTGYSSGSSKYQYPNGDYFFISDNGSSWFTYNGKHYSQGTNKDFWDVHKNLNNGDPYLKKVAKKVSSRDDYKPSSSYDYKPSSSYDYKPSSSYDYKPSSSSMDWDAINAQSKSSWKDDRASTVEDEKENPKEEFASLLEDLKEDLGKKFVTKVNKLLKSWLKKIKSKKYKECEIGSDDVYGAFNSVLSEDDVDTKNVSKRVQQEMKDLID